ncbi:MAG: DUF1801 domain-containing protein [Cyclobacteriaceae bacterium]|jgi:uncharacterized protein YdhG (YjbR/CyaY superfamily)|nr:DUF1801 domain-containing protein [Cyclobacteriaceae bacterium]
MQRIPASNIDEYISVFPIPIREKLEQLRAAIIKAAPGAQEKMSYAIPTFFLNGNLVHFAAYKNHIGFYPAPSGIRAFNKELRGFVTSKGAIQFPLAKALPVALVHKIVKFRVKENLEKVKPKKPSKKKVK